MVLVDGQGSGLAAKMLSNALSSKAIAMLKEGARDGAVARATHDYLHHYRGGRVSATLDIVSVDLVSQTIVVCRNSHGPLLVRDEQGVQTVATESGPIGPYRHTRPDIRELPITPGLQVAVFTDGILTAGERCGQLFDAAGCLTTGIEPAATAAAVADRLLAGAIAADDGRPNDDMTVIALTIQARPPGDTPLIRRLTAALPLDGPERRSARW